MDRDSKLPELKVTRMGGLDQRTAPDDLDAEGHPGFSILEGLFPWQDGVLARIPGKSLLYGLPGEIILNIFQPFDSTGNILVQTNLNLYAFTLDELLGRVYTPTITASSGSEDESMSLAILSQKLANATLGGPLGGIAVGTLTSTGVTSDAETVTIAGKVYTFQTVLTNVDGHVLRGATSAIAYTNLFHAINASGGTAGTDYAAATTANTSVFASNPSATTVVVAAIAAGTIGNGIGTTETLVNGSWGGANLAGGVDALVDTFYPRGLGMMEVNQNSIVTAFGSNAFTLGNGTYRISVSCVWNPINGGAAIVGTTIGLYNNTSAAFEVYAGGTEPILGTAGKASTVSNTESANTVITMDAVFTVSGGAKSYSIMQKGSLQAAIRGTSFCGIHDQCTTNANVNSAKSSNYYLQVKIWMQP